MLSGLASPLHLYHFPNAPFASSCRQFLLPPTSYKDVENLFILASCDGMPRSVEKAAGARLPTRRLCAGRPCSPKYRTRRHSRPSASFTASFSPAGSSLLPPPFSLTLPLSLSFVFSRSRLTPLSRTVSFTRRLNLPIQAHLSGKVFTVNVLSRIFRALERTTVTWPYRADWTLGGITSSVIRDLFVFEKSVCLSQIPRLPREGEVHNINEKNRYF